MPKKLTHEQVEERIKLKHGNKFTLIDRYTKKSVKIKTLCNTCGYEWLANAESLWRGFGCPSCANQIQKTTEGFKKEVFELVGDEYTVLGEYKTTHTPILIKHNVCGKEFKMRPKAFLHDGQRCPNERYLKSANSNVITQGNPIQKNVKLKDICEKEGYEIIKGYVNAKTKLKLMHTKCGNIYEPRPYAFIEIGTRCYCENQSKGERVIKQWLDENNIEYKEQYKFKDCRGIMHPLPFDFALFNRGELLLLIEFDGLQHFMPKFGKDSFEEIKKNDTIKNNFCIKNNIPLIRIKYNRALKLENFRKKVIDELIENINKAIPSEASRKLLERVETR